MAVRLWALLAGFGLTGCTVPLLPRHLPPCGLSGAIVPDVQSGLRQPPKAIIATLRCKLDEGAP